MVVGLFPGQRTRFGGWSGTAAYVLLQRASISSEALPRYGCEGLGINQGELASKLLAGSMNRFTQRDVRWSGRMGQRIGAALLALLVPKVGNTQQQCSSLAPMSQNPKSATQPVSPEVVPQVSSTRPALSSSAPVVKGHLSVEAIPLNAPTASRVEARKSSYRVRVAGSDWIDTHLQLATGDAVTLSSEGEATLADGRKVTADGVTRGWKDLLRNFPDNASPAGALVGRIGSDPAVVPFVVGTDKRLNVATGGELFLRINASSDLTPAGEFSVVVKIAQDKAAVHAQAAAVRSEMLELPPTLFDDVPRRVQDQEGDLGDMVNFALIGSQEKLEKAFETAGWVKVDNNAQDAVVHGVLATLAHKPYLELPMSTLYLFGRAQDFSYARADPITVAAERHHLRVWRTDNSVNGRPLWVGSSTHDVGFETDQRNGDVTHKIDPEIDFRLEQSLLLQRSSSTTTNHRRTLPSPQ